MTVLYGNSYNENSIRVSIVVPCYNVEKYLPRCLDTLLNQTLDGVEVIAINDGSPDSCLEILKGYQNRYPGSLVIIDKANEGVWRGRQDAIEIAAGAYIGFVDSDDYVEPTFCEELYSAAIATDSDIAVCGFSRVDLNTGYVLSRELVDCRYDFSARNNPELLLQLNGAPWNKFFKAQILKDMYDFENPPRIFDDLMMHLLIYPRVDKIVFVSKSLVNYVVRNDSIMTTINKSKIDSAYQGMCVVKSYYDDLKVSESLNDFLDAAAFLHLGVSLMFRLSYDKSADLHAELQRNQKYLDTYFPAWKSDAVISKENARRYKGAFQRVYWARKVYVHGLMPSALRCYRFYIGHSHHDIKW